MKNAHSSTSILLHIVLTRKYRSQFTESEQQYIYGNLIKHSRDMNCKVISMNTQNDHIHLLSEIHSSISVATYVKALKLRTFKRLKEVGLIPSDTSNYWSRGYFAGSVGKNLEAVKDYIKNQ